MANNLTQYQKLQKVFSIESGSHDPQGSTDDTKQIINAASPQEIHSKALELQQQKAIREKFFKIEDHAFQKAMQYEAARLPAYLDYEGMEYYPLIAAALDLFMEEATVIGDNGKMLNVYCKKERIKGILEDFFYGTLNVNVNLPFWCRNLPIKYDSIIPLLDGSEKTIQEIALELKTNPNADIWTYSIQENTNNVKAGKIIWCDLTRKNSSIYRVTLDDGTYVETTGDHEFMLRNGKFKKAIELQNGDRLMPFNTRKSEKSKDNLEGYEKIYNPLTHYHKFTHRMVADDIHRNLILEKASGEKHCTHHRDLNPSLVIDNRYIKSVTISKSKTKIYLNHQVVSVELLSETEDVYCMEVVGFNNEQDRHNFPICSKDTNGNYTRNGVFVSNCKYGDNFVYLLSEKNKGITHIKQMVNYEIERLEMVSKGKSVVRFKNREGGDEYQSFEMAHFRLLGDNKYLPYGSSLLNKTRRVFRQLILAEDAMLTYRILRAGEKRVFKVDVGNMDDKDIEAYVQKVATRFKKQQQINPNAGQIDYRFNILGNDEDYFIPVRNLNNATVIDTVPGACIVLDTKIPLLDGRTLELKEIIKEYNQGKELWTYSVNPKTGEIVPGPISWAGVTRKNTQVLKVTLDNGESITCTPDHKFPSKFNGIKQAKDLEVGESLWSFNKKFEKIKGAGKSRERNTYEMIYNHSKKDWVYTHRMVANYFKDDLCTEFTYNNKFINENTKKLWVNESFRNQVIEPQTINYSDKMLDLLVDYFDKHGRLDYILDQEINVENSEFLNEFWFLNSDNNQLKTKFSKITRTNIDKMLKHFGYVNYNDFKKKVPCYNHKIISIEYLDELQDTGTLTIDKEELYHNYHNFPVNQVFIQNSNLDQIQDIEYLRDNLFTALGVPKPFLGFQDSAGDGKNMAQFDIRFAKKVNRIQQALIQELNRMAIIHLFMLGYEEEIEEFTLTLTNPSRQADILKAEILSAKIDLYTNATSRTEGGLAAMSHTRAKKEILNWSDKEIMDDYKNQRMEMALSQELQDTALYIKKTGIFKDVDEKYGSDDPLPKEQEPGEGDIENNEAPGGEEGGDQFNSPAQLPEPQGTEESVAPKILKSKIINEAFKRMDYIVENLINGEDNKEQINDNLMEENSSLIKTSLNSLRDIDEQLKREPKAKKKMDEQIRNGIVGEGETKD